MRVSQEKVEAFMERIGDTVNEQPTLADIEGARRRLKLMQEELDEYEEAVNAGDLVKIADALGDLIYTVLGTASFHGIQLTPVFDEIHRSNMTKNRAVNFKGCVKGPIYEPPRLAEVLLLQSTGLAKVEVI